MSKIAKFGYRPDLGDARDHIYQVSTNTHPKSVDLSKHMPPCWDQQSIGSCTGFGITAVITYLHGFVGSQLWLYYNERLLENTVSVDAGASIRDGIKIVAKNGLPPLEAWPYVIKNFKKKPSKKADDAAKSHLVSKYQRLDNAAAYKDALANGHPFVIGISVYDSFETDDVAKWGNVPMPSAHDKLIGGHCISVFGYKENGDWICRNSWGTGWGDNGKFVLPKAYLENPNLCDDAWIILA
jgi:C1A family cysteine protease